MVAKSKLSKREKLESIIVARERIQRTKMDIERLRESLKSELDGLAYKYQPWLPEKKEK